MHDRSYEERYALRDRLAHVVVFAHEAARAAEDALRLDDETRVEAHRLDTPEGEEER
jgi:hypothetical protein